MKEIGKRIKQIRQFLELNQGEFSKRIEMSQSMLSGIENGRETITDRNTKLICLEFGVNEDWLSAGNGEMFRSMELAPDEKDLLAIYEKLESEGRKQVRDYAAERLELQLHRKDIDKAWNEGLGKQTQNEPPEAPQEDKPAQDTEKGENPGIGPNPKNGETG
jgi:transcriptional regulator with XRE-family HTH domain